MVRVGVRLPDEEPTLVCEDCRKEGFSWTVPADADGFSADQKFARAGQAHYEATGHAAMSVQLKPAGLGPRITVKCDQSWSWSYGRLVW